MQQRPFLIIAHRGTPRLAPENTIAGFDRALELGFRHLELDAQLSADGVPVVFHDSTLERTSSGSGPLARLTLAELRALDAGRWFNQQFAGERIPTLEEVLVRYRGRAHIHLELKSEEAELPGAVAGLLKSTGWPCTATHVTNGWPETGVTISSFHKPQLERTRALLPGVPLAWLVHRLSQEVLGDAVEAGFLWVCPRASEATRASVENARHLRLKVRAWGLRDLSELDRLVEHGVEGTTCDWPDVARQHLRSRGVPSYP